MYSQYKQNNQENNEEFYNINKNIFLNFDFKEKNVNHLNEKKVNRVNGEIQLIKKSPECIQEMNIF